MTLRRPILVHGVRTTATTATGRFRVGRRRAQVAFQGVAPDATSAPEAFAAIARIMGMENERSVWTPSRLSPSFVAGMDHLQAVHLALFPQHHASPLRARRRRDRPAADGPSRRTAAFFSGGVDSFDLVLEHGDGIDDLLFVRGFDVAVHDRARGEEVLSAVRAGAAALGKPLLELGTDLREFSDPTSDWTWFVYAGLLSTTVLLERTHRRVLCAASVADRHLPAEAVRLRAMPFGNDRTELGVEGRVATRIEKLIRVADAGVARDTLRVCWQNAPGTVNCGTCTKCVRTAIGLAAVGRLGAIATLPDRLDLDAVAAQPARTRSERAYLQETLEAASAHGQRDLVRALRRAFDRASRPAT